MQKGRRDMQKERKRKGYAEGEEDICRWVEEGISRRRDIDTQKMRKRHAEGKRKGHACIPYSSSLYAYPFFFFSFLSMFFSGEEKL